MKYSPEELAARKAEWEREPSQAEIDEAIEEARRPALLLNKTKFPDDPGEPGCWLHGEPTLPPEIAWPYQEVGGVPWSLFFVAQINLARVPRSVAFPNVPEAGTLFFFYDPALATTDAKVVYVDRDVSGYPPRDMPEPEYRPVDEWSDKDVFDVIEENLHPRWNFDFLPFDRIERNKYNGILDNRNLVADCESCDAVEELTKDRWDSSEQGSLHSASTSHLFGCQPGAPTPKGNPALLLVIGGAPIYNFWIDKDALQDRDFDRAFVTIGG